ncbi:MAG TPA: GNAT family N-acetyltransferase [Spirochaetia bacterium]|nr:MAG: hypothetical protein A2Y41_10425 [Spirochaetes bacterium GWB1_36_13]HCL55872.1 GNAT family N-acetyltransferase [Spirochaetia bacterium]
MKNFQFKIKEAELTDISLIAPLFDQYRIFYGQKSFLSGAGAFLMERFQNQESYLFFAHDFNDPKIVFGFTQLYPTFSSVSMKPLLILNDLFVDEPFRKEGIAFALLTRAKEFARNQNAKGLTLSTALENSNAQKLYQKFGFQKEEEFISFHYFFTQEPEDPAEETEIINHQFSKDTFNQLFK